MDARSIIVSKSLLDQANSLDVPIYIMGTFRSNIDKAKKEKRDFSKYIDKFFATLKIYARKRGNLKKLDDLERNKKQYDDYLSDCYRCALRGR